MSCPHGNHPDACDICDEVAAAYNSGVEHTKLAQTEQEPWLLESTQTLAKSLAREFYPEVPQWECLNDLAGVISQIDNMTTGLMRKPEQEPVAWMTINEYGEEDDIHYENPEGHLLEGWTYKPLYTHPPSVQPKPEPLEYWNAVEGWVKIDEVHEHFDSVGCGTIYKTAGEDRVPLYTSPPKREWAGLSDKEISVVVDAYTFDSAGYEIWTDGEALVRDVQSKLKERNT